MHDSESSQLNRIEKKLDAVLKLAKITLTKETAMANVLDNLEASVASLTTVEQSAEMLLTSINDQLKAALASNDPTRIQAVVDKIDATKAAWAAAVAANTPAAPAATTRPHARTGH